MYVTPPRGLSSQESIKQKRFSGIGCGVKEARDCNSASNWAPNMLLVTFFCYQFFLVVAVVVMCAFLPLCSFFFFFFQAPNAVPVLCKSIFDCPSSVPTTIQQCQSVGAVTALHFPPLFLLMATNFFLVVVIPTTISAFRFRE